MPTEKEIEERVGQYAALAKENKDIDAAALMMSVLEQSRQEEVDAKKKRRAYLVSVGFPPFGLLYAVRYFFSDKADGKHVALMCVILTVVSLAIGIGISALMFSCSGVSLDQVQNVNVEDVRSLLQ